MENEIREIQYSQNSVIFVENSINEGYFYILQSGSIIIQSDIDFDDKCLLRYQSGDTFGLVSSLTNNPILNTLIAEIDCTVLQIPISLLGNYLHTNREICLKIIALYSNQLRALDSYLARNSYINDYIEHPSKLLADGEYYSKCGRLDMASYCLGSYLSWAKKVNYSQKSVQAAQEILHAIDPNYEILDYDSNILTFKKGGIIFVENEPADYFFVIQKGAVKISKLVSSQEFILCILREGEIFGEMAILNKKFRNATAIAFEDTTILRLPVQAFMDEIGEKILFKMFESFARRIWYAYKRVFLLGLNNPNARLYSYLQILISDVNVKNKVGSSKEYIFNFTIQELKGMIGMANLSDERIQDFLSDPNIDISEHSIRVYDSRKLYDRVELYKNRDIQRNLKIK